MTIASLTTAAFARARHNRPRLYAGARAFLLFTSLLGATIANSASAAIFFTPFGPSGEGGTINGQVLSFGSGGEVFELDAFLNIAGTDLNGATLGTSAQLSVNPLPAGLAYSFTTELSPDETDLTLRYEFINNSGSTLPDAWFFSFVDAEIDVAINDYFNEAGFQFGTPGSGSGDADADAWEIDEPGYVFGDILSNMLTGSLDNTNAVPLGAPDDVSMSLAFSLGNLPPNYVATIDILLSEDGDTLGALALQQFDTESFDTLTQSGIATIEFVPEPNSFLVMAIGATLLATFATHRRNALRDFGPCRLENKTTQATKLASQRTHV